MLNEHGSKQICFEVLKDSVVSKVTSCLLSVVHARTHARRHANMFII